jgi:hypothetical protein
MADLKHVGRVRATNRKCVVAYRTLPGDAYSCLIVATENLPDSYHDAIINLVQSPAGQEAYEFAEVMDRSTFPDGSRMLPNLHANGRLLKLSTSEVDMLPNAHAAIQLSELNQIIAEQRGLAVDQLAVAPAPNDKPVESKVTPKPEAKVEQKTVQPTESAQPTSFESPEEEAKFYRSQADKLAKEAAAMRRKAEELVPTPKKKAKETA